MIIGLAAIEIHEVIVHWNHGSNQSLFAFIIQVVEIVYHPVCTFAHRTELASNDRKVATQRFVIVTLCSTQQEALDRLAGPMKGLSSRPFPKQACYKRTLRSAIFIHDQAAQ